jgi:hypothetical protein
MPEGEIGTALLKKKPALLIALLFAATVTTLFISRLGERSFGSSNPSARAMSTSDAMADLPKIILWAWERPEQLGFINTREVGVAYLARTIFLRDDRVITRPRLQPLSVPPDARLIAVARIETAVDAPPALSPLQRTRVVKKIAGLAQNKSIVGIQIDFDARESERAFYRDLLFDLRKQLPASIKLSITALASWCIGDNWIEGLPIDEAVPMLFRMGADRQEITNYLKSGREFRAPLSQHSIGISTDEPLKGLPSGRRVYIFNPRSWTEEQVNRIIEEVKQWQ